MAEYQEVPDVQNGWTIEHWKKRIADLPPDELARIIVSDLKFVHRIGERWGTYNAAVSIQRGLATPEEVLEWPQAQDDWPNKLNS